MRTKRAILCLMFCFTLSIPVFAQQADSLNKNTIQDSLFESFILSPDDEVLLLIDQALANVYSKAFIHEKQSDTLAKAKDTLIAEEMDEQVIASRIANLNRDTPFELVYNNHVQAFINLYVIRKREVTERILGVAPYYYPLFEQELAKHNLPLELKYLPIVESALNPTAKSRAGAVGLWQFMYTTGRMYGLKVTSYYDQRMDPMASTVAACRYLSALYDMYNDWSLVIAAYNCGPGNVNKAIRRSGGEKDFWKIRNWLPRETRGYVPAFMAVSYVMSHYEAHGIQAVAPPVNLYPTDTVYVCGNISFESVARTLEISEDWLKYFNPMYRYNIVPESDDKLSICLPLDKIGLFIMNEDSIYSLHRKNEEIKKDLGVAIKGKPSGNEIIHRVRSGDVLGGIAQRYNCRVSDIKEWNNLWSSRIYPGQRLKIYTNKPPVAQNTTKTTAPVKKEPQKTGGPLNGKFRYYTIQPGDTLWDIAKKYKQITVNDLKELNSDLDFRKLKPGDKIKVLKVG